MSQIISTYETATQKTDRKYGYRVYRSSDGGLTWIDLTSADYEFQQASNSGLLHPAPYTERMRSNETAKTFDAVSFIDYSVNAINTNQPNGDEKARIYYYKIVPVYNGEELSFTRKYSSPQNTIRVVLPPPNMALVHRLIANRTTCQEIGKEYSTDIHDFYSCEYNGVGSRSLEEPWDTTKTVYDFGNDILMDRFEIGCNITRGDFSNTRSSVDLSVTSIANFMGLNDKDTQFRGCLSPAHHVSIGAIDSENYVEDTPYISRSRFRRGDCQFSNLSSIFNSSSTCNDPSSTKLDFYNIPGIDDGIKDCTMPNQLTSFIFDPYLSPLSDQNVQSFNAQSEFLAVAHNNNGTYKYQARTATQLRAGNGSAENSNRIIPDEMSSSCMINLNLSDNSTDNSIGKGRMKSRWIPANHLINTKYSNGTTSENIDLFNMTVSELKNDTRMYGGSQNSVPSFSTSYNNRYNADTKLGRIISSNASKLPPLQGFSQENAHDTCKQYKVSMGYFNDSTETFDELRPANQKRLMRRPEGIVAGAWNSSFDQDKITNIENGEESETPFGSSATEFNGSCNTFNKNIASGLQETKPGNASTATYLSNETGTSTLPERPLLITGSSFFDGLEQSPNQKDYNTQFCVSKYGIQDLVGNLSERSSEQVFCDFSAESLWLGFPPDTTGVSVTFEQGNGDYYYDSSLSVFVNSKPGSGGCSFVEKGSSRSGTYVTGTTMNPLFDFTGALNTNLVLQSQKYDQKAIQSYRNGDGYFLDFGEQRLAPPLSYFDTLALKFNTSVSSRSSKGKKGGDDPRMGMFFNPIVGMPLTCGGTSCDQSSDNKNITTNEFITWQNLDENDFEIKNFPINNSNILSSGMSESSDTILYTFPLAYSIKQDYITEIDPSNNTFSFYSDSSPDGLGEDTASLDGTILKTGGYTMSRSTPPSFKNFGDHNTNTGAGRYALEIDGTHSRSQRANQDHGFRCVVTLDN